MVKNVNAEFKQQSIDHVLSNTYLSISKLANHLGVGKSTHDKWVSQLIKIIESEGRYLFALINDIANLISFGLLWDFPFIKH